MFLLVTIKIIIGIINATCFISVLHHAALWSDVGYYAGVYAKGIDLCLHVHDCLMDIDGTSY